MVVSDPPYKHFVFRNKNRLSQENHVFRVFRKHFAWLGWLAKVDAVIVGWVEGDGQVTLQTTPKN
jgi:hypothetical protein